jgi:Zn-dependent membrane protease YugP
MTIGIIAISIIFMLLGMLVQFRLKSKFTEYSKVLTGSGLSGSEIAKKMLRDNGIYDVQVISTPGFLSDHLTPLKKPLT